MAKAKAQRRRAEQDKIRKAKAKRDADKRKLEASAKNRKYWLGVLANYNKRVNAMRKNLEQRLAQLKKIWKT